MKPDLQRGKYCYCIDTGLYIKGEGYPVSVVIEDISGHYLTGDADWRERPGARRPWIWGPTLKDAEAACEEQNRQLGVSPERAFEIVTSSMRAQNLEERRGRRAGR